MNRNNSLESGCVSPRCGLPLGLFLPERLVYGPAVRCSRLFAHCTGLFALACSASAPSFDTETNTEATGSSVPSEPSGDAGVSVMPTEPSTVPQEQEAPPVVDAMPVEGPPRTEGPDTNEEEEVVDTSNSAGDSEDPNDPENSTPGETADGGAPPPVAECLDGELSCSDSVTVAECREGRWVEAVTCSVECAEESGTAVCTGSCEPGAVACTDEVSRVQCAEDGEWLKAEACTAPLAHCVAGICEPCRPNDRRCTGNEPEVCIRQGEALQFAPQGECSGDRPACVEGRCEECTPLDERLCPGAEGACSAGRQVCGPDATWGACSVQPLAVDDCTLGIDTNCDGELDCECIAGATRGCGARAGSFGCSTGEQTCTNSAPDGSTQWGPCVFTPQTDGTSCFDTNPITIGDQCGICQRG